MYPGPIVRDRIAARARRDLWSLRNRFPFPHQAEFWLAMEGWVLTDQVLHSWEHDQAVNVRGAEADAGVPFFDVLVARYEAFPAEAPDERRIVTVEEFWRLSPVDQYLESGPAWKIDDNVRVAPLVERRAIVPRQGGVAKRCAMLTGFSGGKSDFLGGHVAPLLLCPEVQVDLVGMTYDIAEPEFKYVQKALFSADGFNIPLEKRDFPCLHKARMTNPRPGVMPEIVLSNGSILRVVSYENRENLKGKSRDCLCFAEYYQFPGFNAYSDIAQNLDKDERAGIALFATTPDSAHIETLIDFGKSPEHPSWHVTTNVPRMANPYAFKFAQMEEDRMSMTREKFKIGQLGIVGQYIGSAFSYMRGERIFTTRTHPEMWHDPQGRSNRDNFRLPDGFVTVGGADTGSHYGAVVAAFSDDAQPSMFILDEITNYRYVATEIEKSPTYTLSQWYRDMYAMSMRYGGDGTFWCDPNAQMKHDAAASANIALLPDKIGEKAETRTEIFREYFQNDRVFFAPWLEVVPYECELARFPPASTSTGIWKRISEKDHALDPCEHIAAQRPTGKSAPRKRKRFWIEERFGINYDQSEPEDPHMGV